MRCRPSMVTSMGVWLSRRPMWQGPVLGFFWMFQGLWFFLFTHQWRVL